MPKNKKRKRSMPDDAKHHLKASMKGSWYNQEDKQDQRGTSVSSRKIQTETEYLQEENRGSIIMDLDILNSQIGDHTCCSKCYGKMNLSVIPSKQNGLCSSLLLKCQNVQCNHTSEFFTSKLCTSSSHSFEVNRSVVLGMRLIGKGRNAASKFCAAMNLPQPVSATPYSDHTKHITEKTKIVLLQELLNAGKRGHTLKESEDENLCPESVVDCGVTIDGSWLNRGLSSRHGFVTVISIDTGEVLDVHYMCSVCPECSKWEDKTSPEYLEWFLSHESECMLNHDGSAQSMETEGASILFNRSVQKYNLRYNPFIGDGDSKAFLRVLRDKPYGDIEIQKEECVGHIQKRMGTRLRNLITKYKGNFSHLQHLLFQ